MICQGLLRHLFYYMQMNPAMLSKSTQQRLCKHLSLVYLQQPSHLGVNKIESIPFFSEHNKKRRSLILSWTEQMNSFYMIGTSVMKELNPDSHLWSRLRHKSKHCVNLHEIKKPRVKYEACVETRITKNLNSVKKYPVFMTRFLYIFYIFNPLVPDVH